MNVPRDLGPDFRAWLRDVPPMPAELPGRTLERTQSTRQRRRWLWFLPGPKPTAGAEDEQDRLQPPVPIPKDGGLAPTTRGGTRTMFSATKLVGAAAVVALFGGLLLVAGPLAQQEEPMSPGASTPAGSGEITPFSGRIQAVENPDPGSTAYEEWGRATEGQTYLARIEVGDPRLDGYGLSMHNVYGLPGASYGVRSVTVFWGNEGGSWAGSCRGFQDPETTGLHYQCLMDGQDGYDGLHVMYVMGQSEFSAVFDAYGAIIDFDLPTMPDPAPMEIPVPSEDT